MHHIFHKADNLLGGIERIHGRLRDVGNLTTQNGLAHIVGTHAGNVLPIDADIAAHVIQRREVVTHQTERQCGLAAAGFTRNPQRTTFRNPERNMVNRIDIFPKRVMYLVVSWLTSRMTLDI